MEEDRPNNQKTRRGGAVLDPKCEHGLTWNPKEMAKRLF